MKPSVLGVFVFAISSLICSTVAYPSQGIQSPSQNICPIPTLFQSFDVRRVHSGEEFEKCLNELPESQILLANFFAPWCSFSQRFHPLFAEIARIFPFPAFSIDASRINNFNSRFSVHGFPTFVLARKGVEDVMKFEGDKRNLTSLIQFISSRTGYVPRLQTPVHKRMDTTSIPERVEQPNYYLWFSTLFTICLILYHISAFLFPQWPAMMMAN